MGMDMGMDIDMEMVLSILSGVFISLGIVAILIGMLGLLRLPDLYSRVHAVGIIDTAGVAFFILGMLCLSGWSLVSVKLVFIGVFLFFTSPIASHAIVRAAHLEGIEAVGRDMTKAPKKRAGRREGTRGGTRGGDASS